MAIAHNSDAKDFAWEFIRFMTGDPEVQDWIVRTCQIRNFQNIDGFIGEIVSSGKATLRELKTVYTLEDAFQLWEVVALSKYNEWKLSEFVIEQAKRKQR